MRKLNPKLISKLTKDAYRLRSTCLSSLLGCRGIDRQSGITLSLSKRQKRVKYIEWGTTKRKGVVLREATFCGVLLCIPKCHASAHSDTCLVYPISRVEQRLFETPLFIIG